MKILINCSYGNFDLSHEAIMHYAKIKNFDLIAKEIDENSQSTESNSQQKKYVYTIIEHNLEKSWNVNMIERSDPAIIKVFEELDDKANNLNSKLKIMEIPDDVVKWRIESYHGIEWIVEDIENLYTRRGFW